MGKGLMKNRDKNSGKFVSNNFKVECDFCHKEITVIEWKLKHYKKHFCSRSCKSSFYSGLNHVNFKHGLRIRNRTCACGKKLSETSDSLRCKSCANKGILNPGYIDGKSKSKYSNEFTTKLRESIRKRDGNKCVICGMTKKQHFDKYNRNLEVHHKDHNRDNCKENNLETRCKKCNIEDNKIYKEKK
jgi:hypothetical protein